MRKKLSRSLWNVLSVRIKTVFAFFSVVRPRKEKLSIERQMSLMRACHRQKS